MMPHRPFSIQLDAVGSRNGKALKMGREDRLLDDTGDELWLLPPADGIYSTAMGASLLFAATPGQLSFQAAGNWNDVNAIAISGNVDSLGGDAVLVSNFVHTQISLVKGDDRRVSHEDVTLTVEGAKRGILDTGDGNDVLTLGISSDGAGAGNDFRIGTNGGDDLIVLRGAAPGSVVGAAWSGNDTTGQHSYIKVHSGTGNDTIDASALNTETLLNGYHGNDTIIGSLGVDYIRGGNDNDSLSGNDGDDLLRGDKGDDTLGGGDGDDYITGDNGNDVLGGGADDDTLGGGRGDDTLAGDAGDDVLSGGKGADVFVLGTQAGTDVITDFNIREGDKLDLSGNNVRSVDDLTVVQTGNKQIEITLPNGNKVTINGLGLGDLSDDLLTGLDVSPPPPPPPPPPPDPDPEPVPDLAITRDTIRLAPVAPEWFETFRDGYGSNIGTDVAALEARLESITGTVDSDVVIGRFYLGGASDSNITSDGLGPDLIIGDAESTRQSRYIGSDTIEGSDHADGDVIFCDFWDDNLMQASNDLAGQEYRGNDSITAGDGDDLVFGQRGNDRLFGGDGDDQLYGGGHNDYLEGGDGDDTLVGGAGQDTIVAGADGNDWLRGDVRADVFVFGADARDGHHVVADFVGGEDVMHMAGYSFAELTIMQSGEHTVITYDHAGDTGSITLAFTDASILSAGDFLFA